MKLHELISKNKSWCCRHRVWTYIRVSSRTFGSNTSIVRSRCSWGSYLRFVYVSKRQCK